MAATDDVERVRNATRESGHLRHVVWRGTAAVGAVHVRDTLAAPAGTTAAEVMRPILHLPADSLVYTAIADLRRRRSQFALVSDGDELIGLITMQDLLDRLLGHEAAVSPSAG